MKQITLLITAILMSPAMLAKAISDINYQTVICDGDGNILKLDIAGFFMHINHL